MNLKSIRLIFIILVVSLFGSCKQSSPKLIRPLEINGINGEALYTINPNGKVILVTKKAYQTPDYNIVLNHDTVLIGEDFVGRFAIMREKYKILINSPSIKIITSDSSSNGDYIFTPDSLGTYNYQGQIEYDSTIIPFEFKFIVIQK